MTRHKKYVELALRSTNEFSIKFKKFYVQAIKAKIQRCTGARFHYESKCWLMDLSQYYTFLEMIQDLCLEYSIDIQ